MDNLQDFGEQPTQVTSLDYRTRGGFRRLRDRIARSVPLRVALVAGLIALFLLALIPGVIYLRTPHPVFATAIKGDVILTTQAQGTIQETLYSADFAVSGAIAKIDVAPGQQVSVGDTLATLNLAPFQAAVSAAQASVSSAQSSVSTAQNAVVAAQTALGSAQTTLSEQQSYASAQCALQPPDPAACAAANATVTQAQAQVDAAQAQVAQAQAQAQVAQTALVTARNTLTIAQKAQSAATLKAPHAGIIVAINGQVGGRPAPNGGPFITIGDLTEPFVTAPVSYRVLSQIEVGENATIRAPQVSSSSGRYLGSVSGYSLVSQGSGDKLAYPVLIQIDPGSVGGAKLLPGMDATATIILRARYHVVTVPVSAITYAQQAAPQNGKGLLTVAQTQQAIQQANDLERKAIDAGLDVSHDPPKATYLVGFTKGHYYAIPVVLGLSDGNRQEIIAGLSAGQQVVVR